MNRYILPAVALIALASVAVAAEVKSGLVPGKTAAPFTVNDITGPSKGKSLCYRCEYEDRPVTCIFIRETSDEVAGLIQQIDATVEENKSKDMKAFVVLLTEDAEAGAKQLAKLAETKGIKNVPLTIFETPEGPRNYKLSEEAAVTVLMWKKAKVAVNHAFGSAKLTADEIKTVVGDTSKILE